MIEKEKDRNGLLKQHSISHVLYWTIIYLHLRAPGITSFR